MKLVESREGAAVAVYREVARARPDLAEELEALATDEVRHEAELVEGIDEGRVRYLSSIALGVSDALVELTGVYTGSLGAFASTVSAGLAGLLAGVAASVSMAVAAYTQAKHERGRSPTLSAAYTGAAYSAVTVLLALPYLTLGSMVVAYAVMLLVAFAVAIYMAAYSAVLGSRRFLRELAETAGLVLGVSLALYLLGSALGRLLGVGNLG
jgi:VIT1/CCC1 family predicted Fe2+/Mn2+ transporter